MNESSTVRRVEIPLALFWDLETLFNKLITIQDGIPKDELANFLLEMKDVYSRLDIAWRKA